jgi:hypothetical protein
MHWREPLDPARHIDWFYPGVGGRPRTISDPLIAAWSYFVRAGGVTLEFASTAQLSQALEFFSEKIHPSSADPHANANEKGEWQAWHARLPKGLARESSRQQIVKSLRAALAEYGDPGPATMPAECQARPFLDFLRDRGVTVTFTPDKVVCQSCTRQSTIPNAPIIQASLCTRALAELGLDPRSFIIT